MGKWGWVVLLAFALSGGAAQAGEITGKVTLKSKVPPRAVGQKKVRTRAYQASERDQGGVSPGKKLDEVQFLVVELVDPAGKLKASPGQAVMHQKGKQFIPHVLPVVVGSKVKFANDDDLFHHIYSPGLFEIPKYKGKFKDYAFEKRGPAELFCGIHTRMNAYIYVTQNDFFAMPSQDHVYKITGVPAGSYLLRTWHPRVPPTETKVVVPAKGAVTVDLTI